MNRRLFISTAALAVISMMASGCVAAVAAGAAGGVGGYAWASGKLSFTTSHGISTCHNATLSALRDLGIKVVSDQTDKLAGKIKGETATGESVAVDLEPQVSNVTKIDVRVGFWGNKTQSTIIANAIKGYLH